MSIKEAVILAAGKGTRMKKGQTDLELLSTPKPLLKIGGEPIIEKIVKKLSDLGLNIVVVINPYDEKKFQEALGKYQVTFCYQYVPRGTAHALYSAKDFVEGDLFLVIMGDDLIEVDLEKIVNLEYPSVFGYEHDDLSQYGAIITDQDGLASSIREKELTGRGIVNTGCYIFSREFFTVLNKIPRDKKSGEYYLTEAVQLLYDIGQGLRVNLVDYWKGINRPEELIQAKELMGGEVLVRNARESDLRELLRILHQLSPPSNDERGLQKNRIKKNLSYMISNSDYQVLVAKKSGHTVGTATLLIQRNLTHNGRPYGHIENVVIDGSHRGNGIGRLLISSLVKVAEERECYKVILNCEKENTSFYEKCGFSQSGELEMRIDL